MLIDLTDIFEKQGKLDANIHNKRKVSYSIIVDEIKLALLVELGELANEVRCFKFWSSKGPSQKDIILDEYADGIHFLTSICLRHKISSVFEISQIKRIDNQKKLTQIFNILFNNANMLDNKQGIIEWYKTYLELGFNLGFDLNDIKHAYLNKNAINYQRQTNNY